MADRAQMAGDLRVVGGLDAAGRPVDVAIAGGLVADPLADPAAGAAEFDATGCHVLPGLIDLQVNGAGGCDLTDRPDRLWDVAATLARFGVTAFAPTVISSSPRARVAALEALRAGPPAGWAGAVPLGLHFEGPMIAPGRKGAHPEHRLVAPSAAVIEGWSREGGVLMATVAPELPGALRIIRELVARGVLVSVGHTEATAAQVAASVAAGARLVTHLGNAMPPLSAREPGPIGAALGGSELVAGVIADGHHLDPLTLRLAWRALEPDRFLAVTDTTAALGMPDGPARLGDQDVIVSGGTVRLADGTLAGSAASLPRCLRTLVATAGCGLADAVACCTSTPAALVGDPSRGWLRTGARGDVTILGRNLDVVATIVAGRVVFDTKRVVRDASRTVHDTNGRS
ncbi:amidohydrolase family protein [Pseudofrankia sp. BMG5.37]|uniref:N-acetylglucosamine-6-phosphate deacetylase n=1 Tax=Pseudofrankia sp. BMG5.37 TaxID=3050035 RepID=UPI0028951F93|nr:amidohydrolase family protein [Pseudofrankia sp. BMG5.37]MDT3438199.1 amidohydrolase family protein [Pseudofrankia sp. BMG5.37]